MKEENPLNKTTPLEMERPSTVAHYPRKDDASEVKGGITFIIAVVFFGLGYFTGIN